jgi:lysophospholipase L1-like esterase
MLNLRQLCSIGVVVYLILLLTACGGDTDEGTATSSSSSGNASSSSSSTSSASSSSNSSSSSSGTSVGTFSRYCPDRQPCKIMPLGDSITEGLGMSSGGGYRVELFRRAEEAGVDILFVGSQQNGPESVWGQPFPAKHEGHAGATIEELDLLVVRHNLLGVKPHIILLHIGTNDMFLQPGGAVERLGGLLDDIMLRVPNALLVVSNIIPFPLAAAEVSRYNAEIPNLVAERRHQGRNIIFVDQFSGFSPSWLLEGIHPKAEGYTRMGGIWFQAIYEHLVDID